MCWSVNLKFLLQGDSTLTSVYTKFVQNNSSSTVSDTWDASDAIHHLHLQPKRLKLQKMHYRIQNDLIYITLWKYKVPKKCTMSGLYQCQDRILTRIEKWPRGQNTIIEIDPPIEKLPTPCFFMDFSFFVCIWVLITLRFCLYSCNTALWYINNISWHNTFFQWKISIINWHYSVVIFCWH